MRLTLDRSFAQLNPNFQRQRTSLRVVRLAMAFYQQGLSLRQVAQALRRLGHRVHHVTIWRWLQRCSRELEERVWQGPLPQTIVVDETVLRTGWGNRWLYSALDPKTRRVVFMRGYAQRTFLQTLDFFRELIRIYRKYPQRVIVDGGPWYVWPLRRLGIERQVMRGGVRSYIERFFRYLKQRLNGLDRYFPKARSYRPLGNWLRMFAWYHNQIRKGIPDPLNA